MPETKKPGPAVHIKKFFGLKEGQKMKDFLEEYNNLTDEDKVQLATGIENESLTY